MDTLKTAVVVVLLLAVLYGVYVVLNEPGEPFPEAAPWHQQPMEPLKVDIGRFDPDADLAADPSTSFASTQEATHDDLGTIPQASQETPTNEVTPTAPMVSRVPPDPNVSTDVTAADTTVAAPALLAAPTQPATTPPATTPPADELAAQTPEPSGRSSAWGTPEVPQTNSVTPTTPATTGDAPPAVDAALQAAKTAAEGAVPTSSEAAIQGAPTTGFSQFENLLQTVKSQVENQQWYDALWSLSLFYDTVEISETQRQLMHDWLDPLAARVIYSREHLIEQAYQVQAEETLEVIAERYGVPWQLLANINGVEDPKVLVPGRSLKVLRGPLRADVDLGRNEITVFAGKLYAGRFPITVGADQLPAPGQYRVEGKQVGRTYYAGDGQTIPPGDPTNPYGHVWIDLGNGLCIHGSPQSPPPGSDQGCIRLSSLHAKDLFGILSTGSTISVRR